MEEEIFCPECKDTRVIIVNNTTQECCGNRTKYGDCCNNPILVQYQDQIKCDKCDINLI